MAERMPDPNSRERGSVLMLFPAAVLVVIVLGSIAVDFSVVLLAERELAAAAAAAANDAAAAALDEDHFRTTGEVRLDAAAAERIAAAAIERRAAPFDLTDVRVVVEPDRVAIHLTAAVDYVLAPAIPGVPRGTEAAASATASPRVR